MTDRRPLLVTSALPYANGPLHFGHIAGAYLPADIFVRYHRLKGSEVVYVCGTDEHGVAITRRAEESAQFKGDYKAYVDHWYRRIRTFFDQLHIEFDNFSQTSRPDPHYPLSQEIFNRIDAAGHLEEGTQPQHHCPRCRRFLPDRFVEGTCYICKAENARGDECKKCGSWLDAIQLENPRCATCGATPEIRDVTQWFLKLGDFQDSPDVRPWLESFRTRLKPNVHSFVFTKILEQEGLRSRAITRDLPWGVPVPPADLFGCPRTGTGSKVLYVWFDAPIGYISSTIEWARTVKHDPDLWRRYWIRRDGEEGARLVHFIGKDNIPFHCIVFPAMLAWQRLGAAAWETLGGTHLIGPGPGESWVLPETVPANEFYNLEDRKFNTSEGWYIDLDQAFARYDVDVLRYYITTSFPESSDTSFQWRELKKAANKDLADVLGNLASRVLRFIQNFRDGRVPAPPAPLRPVDQELLAANRRSVEEIGRLIEEYRFKQAAKEVLEIGRRANRYVDETQPWVTRKDDPTACSATLYTACQALRTLAITLWPFIPRSAEKLWAQIGLPGSVRDQTWERAGEPAVPAGLAVTGADPLFRKIEDQAIEEELVRLERQAGRAAPSGPVATAATLPELRPIVTHDDFARLDIRVGRVLAAEPVPRANRLLQLTVDIGLETRTLVAGIAGHYEPGALVGRSVIVLANLEPRPLRGVVSQGMVLAADHEGRPWLLSADEAPPPGTRIK